ncbi:MAG: hypothetical protein ACR2MY_08720 [Candidatus Dormibacteria bacterium]
MPLVNDHRDGALAGRERELGLGLSGLTTALRSEPTITILLGEPGIGKSTFAHAMLDVAKRRRRLRPRGSQSTTPVLPRIGIGEIARREDLASDLGAIAPGVFGNTEPSGDRFSQAVTGGRERTAAELAALVESSGFRMGTSSQRPGP